MNTIEFYKTKAQELIFQHNYEEAYKFILIAYKLLQKKNNIN